MIDIDSKVWLEIVCATLRGGRDAGTAKETADALLSVYNLRFPNKEPNEGQTKESTTKSSDICSV